MTKYNVWNYYELPVSTVVEAASKSKAAKSESPFDDINFEYIRSRVNGALPPRFSVSDITEEPSMVMVDKLDDSGEVLYDETEFFDLAGRRLEFGGSAAIVANMGVKTARIAFDAIRRGNLKEAQWTIASYLWRYGLRDNGMAYPVDAKLLKQVINTPMEDTIEDWFLKKSMTDEYVDPEDLYAEVDWFDMKWEIAGWVKHTTLYPIVLKNKATGFTQRVSTKLIQRFRDEGKLRRASELASEASEEQA